MGNATAYKVARQQNDCKRTGIKLRVNQLGVPSAKRIANANDGGSWLSLLHHGLQNPNSPIFGAHVFIGGQSSSVLQIYFPHILLQALAFVAMSKQQY